VSTESAIRGAALALILAAGLVACGHKGVLLAPLASVPSPPSDIKVVQRGGRVILEWKNPTTYIDGHDLEGIAAVNIWMVEEAIEADKPGAKPLTADDFKARAVLLAMNIWMAVDVIEANKPALKPLTADDFEAKAVLLARITKDQFPAVVKDKSAAADKPPGQVKAAEKGSGAAPKREKTSEPPPLRYENALKPGKPPVVRWTFGLKAEISKRKQSEFSSLSAIRTRALASAPSGLQAVAGNAAVELTWAAPADNIDGSKPAALKGYNLYRSEGGGPPIRLNSDLVKETHFADKAFEFGKTYVYTVRTAAEAVDPFWESDDSAAARVEPKDVFAPAAPADLTSLAGQDYISLTWDPNPDKDLAGYRVWRRLAGQGEYQEMTTALIKETTFQDKAADKGIRYEYAVTAEDGQGNRSERSKAVSEQIKEGRR